MAPATTGRAIGVRKCMLELRGVVFVGVKETYNRFLYLIYYVD